MVFVPDSDTRVYETVGISWIKGIREYLLLFIINPFQPYPNLCLQVSYWWAPRYSFRFFVEAFWENPFLFQLLEASYISWLMAPSSYLQSQQFIIFSLLETLLLSSYFVSDLSLLPPFYKVTCDYICPTRMIWDNLAPWRSLI